MIDGGDFLKWCAIFGVNTGPGGGGDVIGPGASLDNEVAIFSGTTGKIIKQSGVIMAAGIITGATWHGAAVGETYGGTNQTSYALGDLLYSSAANTLSKLPGNITIGKQFLSQTGTGVVSAAPVWSAVTAADITGVVSPANGGTGVDNLTNTITIAGSITTVGKFATSGGAYDLGFVLSGVTSLNLPTSGTVLASASALTTGSILFSTAGVIDQDNANWFWSSANHNLGIGTNSLNSNALVNFGSTKGVGIYDTMVKNGSISGIQALIYDASTYASASSYAQVSTIFASPFVSTAGGQTITKYGTFTAQPILTGNSGTISKFAMFLGLAGGTSGAGGTLPEMYTAYFEQPLAGTARAALYSESAAIGVTATTPPTNGMIVAGNIINSALTASQAVVTDASKNLISLAYSATGGTSNLVARDVNGNSRANNFGSAAFAVTSASGTTVLTAASARYQVLQGTQPQAFNLPDATTLYVGARYEFNNNSTGLLTVNNTSGTLICTVPSGGAVIVICIASVIANGAWDFHYEMPANANYGTSGMVLTGAFAAGSSSQFSVASTGALTMTGSDAFGSTVYITPTVTGGTNVVLSTLINSPTFNLNATNTTYLAAYESTPVVSISGGVTLASGYAAYLKAWSKTGVGTATKLTTLRVEPPSGGTANYSAEFTGITNFGASNQSNFDASGNLKVGTSLGVGVATTRILETAGTNSANRELINLNGTNTYSGNAFCVGTLNQVTLSPTSAATTNTLIHSWIYPNIVLTTGAFTTAYGLVIDGGSTTLGSATIATGITLSLVEPSYGTTKFSLSSAGASKFGSSGQANISNAGIVTLPDALPSLMVGTSTTATSSLATLSSATQASARLTLSGQEFFQASNTSTDGVSFLCMVNRTSNRVVAIADSAKLAVNSSNVLLKFGIRTDITSQAEINAIATDNSTALPLSLNNNGGNVQFFSESSSFGSGAAVIFIGNATTAPTTNPTGGGIMYSQAGAGKWRGSSGTVTTFGPAEPHCPVCDSDFGHEWVNHEKYGSLQVCVKCLVEDIAPNKPYIRYLPKAA